MSEEMETPLHDQELIIQGLDSANPGILGFHILALVFGLFTVPQPSLL